MPIDVHPTTCNLCGGHVELINNAVIYGRAYGSGKAYYCTKCGAYVGTHKPRPKDAMGILANKSMRQMKRAAHELFDGLWSNNYERRERYRWLADKLEIPESECHFGYFDKPMLIKAIVILLAEVADMED